jgi:dimethylargininase
VSDWVAITRAVSDGLAACELTHLPRAVIDVERARVQHVAYEQALMHLGCRVRQLAATPDMPDSVFVEDTAIVLDDVAVVTRPGAVSRRRETTAVEAELAKHRPILRIEAPGTIDGGDVLVEGRTIFVGRSSRTNRAGFDQLRAHLLPFQYDVRAVTVSGALHLKSAVTAIADDTLLINPAWAPADAFAGFSLVTVDPGEPGAANAVRVGDALVYPESFPRTGDRLQALRYNITAVDVSELQKAEGAVTCCCLLFTA